MNSTPEPSSQEAIFKALPAKTRGEIVLLLRHTEKELRAHGAGSKPAISTALKRILPTLSSHELDRWADLMWKDAEELTAIADTPHARSQTHRQSHIGSRLSGAGTEYGIWHKQQSIAEETPINSAERSADRALWKRGASGELRLQFFKKDIKDSFQYFHNISPETLHGLVRGTLRYLDQVEKERPGDLERIYLATHGKPEHTPRHYKEVFGGLSGPMPGGTFVRQMMEQFLTYDPEKGLEISRDTQAIADTLAEYAANYQPPARSHP